MVLTGIGAGFQLEHSTALDYFRAIAAGMPPGGINSAYRDPAQQVRDFRDNYTSSYSASAKRDRRVWNGTAYWRRLRKVSNGAATVSVAVPGTSNHERGTAIDLASEQRTWMFSHGAAFGFVNPSWAKQAATLEPWHWEHTNTTQGADMPLDKASTDWLNTFGQSIIDQTVAKLKVQLPPAVWEQNLTLPATANRAAVLGAARDWLVNLPDQTGAAANDGADRVIEALNAITPGEATQALEIDDATLDVLADKVAARLLAAKPTPIVVEVQASRQEL